MSVSAVSNSDVNLDVKNAIEDRCNSDIFRAAVPYIIDNSIKIAGYTALAVVVASRTNLVGLAVFFTFRACWEVAEICSVALVGRASNNVAEFNELLKPTLAKVDSAGWAIITTYILGFIIFGR